ncbi:MAG: sugar-binding protein, partial [bacterium]
YQIGFGTGDGMANKPIIWIWQKRRTSAGGEILVKKDLNPVGYVLEAKIPWKEISSISPKTGESIAFDIAVDDADQTWERKLQFIWSGDYLFYKDPDVWGVLKFED